MARASREILFLGKGEETSSSRYRATQYFEPLRERGYQPRYLELASGLAPLIRALPVASRAAAVVVSRRLFNGATAFSLRAVSNKLIFDYDDAVYCRSDGSDSKKRSRGFNRMVSIADEVWAGNDTLATAARPFNSSVHVLPTTLDTRRYQRAETQPDDRLIWVGSRSTQRYIEQLLPVLARLSGNHAQVTLTIVADFELHHPGLNIRNVAWSPANEVAALKEASIGLAPLEDNAWTRGKCGFKILQYMAAGLPVIAADLPAQRAILEPDQCGLLVKDDDSWLEALGALLSDAQLRSTMGAAGYQRAQDCYSLEFGANFIAGRLNTMLSGQPGAF